MLLLPPEKINLNISSSLNDIIFLIVLFKKSPKESETYQSLTNSLINNKNQYEIILFDNTPQKNHYQFDDQRVSYYSNGKNNGLPIAYNFAARKCIENNKKYLVIFDQDSFVNNPYINNLLKNINLMTEKEAVLVPTIISNSRIVSPFCLNYYGLANFNTQHIPHPNYAINSFSAISIAALQEIGFFDEFYWLDGLDFHFFHKLKKNNFLVKKMDVTVTHNLSLTENTSIPTWRLNNIAYYEMAFYAEALSLPAILICLFRVIGRAIKRRHNFINKRNIFSYILYTLKGLYSGFKRRYQKIS